MNENRQSFRLPVLFLLIPAVHFRNGSGTITEEAVTYTNTIHTFTNVDGDLQLTPGYGTNSSANGVQTVLPGEYIEFTAPTEPIGTNRMYIGLSYQDGGFAYTTINYCWYIYHDGRQFAVENGTTMYTNSTPYVPGTTKWRITRTGGNIVYYKNGVAVRTVADANPTQPMTIDITMWDTGSGNPSKVHDLVVGKLEFVIATYAIGDYVPYVHSDYRFGYNGMEKDPELKGDGNSYTTEFRQYDPRLGRWMSLDPLMAEFPWQSPYIAFDDNPIVLVDPEGLAASDGGVPYINAWTLGWRSEIIVNTISYGFGGATAEEVFPGDLNAQKAFLEGQMAADVFCIGLGDITISIGSAGLEAAGGIAVHVEGAVVTEPAALITAVGSLVVIGAGAYEVWAATDNLANHMDQYNHLMSKMKAQNAKKRGPASGKNSTTVSNSGKKYDPKTKQEAGPSGKPKVHTVHKKSPKAAKEAARNDKPNGAKGTSVKHTKDQKGGHHYHNGSGTTGKGKETKRYGSKAGKVSNNVHYEYKKRSDKRNGRRGATGTPSF